MEYLNIKYDIYCNSFFYASMDNKLWKRSQAINRSFVVRRSSCNNLYYITSQLEGQMDQGD